MPSPKRPPVNFVINYKGLTNAEVWDYYMKLMDRYLIMKNESTRKVLKIMANLTLDEYFCRVEKLIIDFEEEKK